jgi:hypothetical protein
MRARIVNIIVGFLVVATGTAVLAAPGIVGGTGGECTPPESEVRARWNSAAAIDGARVVDATGDAAIDLSAMDPCGDVVVGAGVLRHLAAGDDATAVVNDLAGADQLITVNDDGIEVMDTHGEVTHPAWSPAGELAWAEDLEVIRIASADRSTVTTLVPPRGSLGAFSPYFADDAIVAVLQEPSPAMPAEDDGLDNLWRFDLGTQKWSQITGFHSRRDLWSAIRTPVVTPDGAVFFVRISADPSSTREPSFELWRAVGDRAAKVRSLPGEMYLAGIHDGRFLWNGLSRTCGGWALFAEGPDGLNELGCGRVTTDPLEIDPDIALGDEHDDHNEGTSDAAIGLAVVVGDFTSAPRARAIARLVPEDLETRIVDHSRARDLIRPGAWAAVVPIPTGADPEGVLGRVRARLSGCNCGAWLAPVAD